MKIIHTLTLPILAFSLGGCSFFKEYNYDDYSVYQYDVDNHPGVGFYESHDYQDDFYKDSPSVWHQHLKMERDYDRL